MTRLSTTAFLAIVLLILVVPDAWAQFGVRSEIGLSAALVPVRFGPDTDNQNIAFEFDDVAYGLVLTRAGLHASVHRGSSTSTQGAGQELDLFDVNLAVMGSVFQDQTEDLPVFVPMMLHSTYRRIRRTEGDIDFAAFEYTGIGLGAGLGLRQEVAAAQLEVRIVPGIGIATRSFGTSTGRTTLLDTDAELAVGELFERFGLVVGYGFRWQSWRVGGPDAFDAAGAGKVTYDGATQSIRLGLSW